MLSWIRLKITIHPQPQEVSFLPLSISRSIAQDDVLKEADKKNI
jgi:hypothetical protein